MEITTLQQRIEERAKKRLENDLLEASRTLLTVGALIGKEQDFKDILKVDEYYNPKRINIIKGQEIFDRLLPKYVKTVTDEILQQIDQIEYLLKNKDQQEDY